MQSSDTSIRPAGAFPVGRERRRGNHAAERVKGTGGRGSGPGHGAREKAAWEEAPWRGERGAHGPALPLPLPHTLRAGRGDRTPRRLGHQRLGAHSPYCSFKAGRLMYGLS